MAAIGAVENVAKAGRFPGRAYFVPVAPQRDAAPETRDPARVVAAAPIEREKVA